MKVDLMQALAEFKKDVVLESVVRRLQDGDEPLFCVERLG